MLSQISGFVKRQPLMTFFVLAFGLSWLVWPLYLAGLISSPLIPVGPFLAAIIVAALTGGKVELKALLGRMVQWRVGPQWYAVALLLPAILTGAAIYVTRSFVGAVEFDLGPWYGVFTLIIFHTLFPLSGAFGEELGWRGYVLPRLQAGRSALSASLILGLIWAAWHLPLFATGVWTQPVPHILAIIALAILYTWLFNRTNGSVLLAMLFHGAFNGVAEFLIPAIGLANLELFWWALAGFTSAAAVGVILLSGRELGRPAPVPALVTREQVVGV
jgi:uncharacterized protein